MMPTFKDPSRTRTYMRLYMQRRRHLEFLSYPTKRRTAILERERQLQESNALLNPQLPKTSLLP